MVLGHKAVDCLPANGAVHTLARRAHLGGTNNATPRGRVVHPGLIVMATGMRCCTSSAAGLLPERAPAAHPFFVPIGSNPRGPDRASGAGRGVNPLASLILVGTIAGKFCTATPK